MRIASKKMDTEVAVGIDGSSELLPNYLLNLGLDPGRLYIMMIMRFSNSFVLRLSSGGTFNSESWLELCLQQLSTDNGPLTKS